MKEKHYYRIDCVGNKGFSLCFVTDEKLLIDEIVDFAVEKNLISKYDLETYYVLGEEITNDKYEMKFWKKQAKNI